MKNVNIITKLFSVIIFSVLVVVITISLALIGFDKKKNNISINANGFNAAYANSVGWGGVRGSATLLRAASQTFNTLFDTIKTWGLLFNYTLTLDGTVPNTVPEVTFKVRINNPKQFQGTVDTISETYSNRIEISIGGVQALQLFFDNPNDSSEDQGCLFIVKPYYFEATPGTSFNNTGIFEARVKKSGSDTIMYITYQGTPWNSTVTGVDSFPVAGRGKMVDDGLKYNITVMSYSTVDGDPYQICAGGGGNAYYTLAYIAKKVYPNYSTALWGWKDDDKNDRVCNLAFDFWGNYGYFNASAGFVCDADTACPSLTDYPAGSAVSTLYSNMQNTAQEFAPANIANPGIGFLIFD